MTQKMDDAQTVGERSRGVLTPRWMRRISVIGAGGVGVVGIAVLVGWYADITLLTTAVPGYVSMKPNTALALLLLAAGVLLIHHKKSSLWAFGLSLAATCIGAATLAEYVLSVSFGPFDLLLPGIDLATSSARMAPATAAAILLLGLALVWDLLGRDALMRGLASAAFAIAYVAILGYIYGVSQLYAVGGYASVAVHTAICLAVLSVALLLTDSQHGLISLLCDPASAGRLLRPMVPFLLLAPAALGWLRLKAQESGHFDTQFGVAVLVMSLTVVGTAVTWRAASRLRDLDRRRDAADLALAESNHALAATYRMLASSAGDVVLRIADGTIEWASPSVGRYGWQPSDFVRTRAV